MATKLFVGNLSFNATTADLEALFGQAGAVSSVNIISDKFTGQSRGFGFVEMGSTQEAQTAIDKMNKAKVGEREIVVNEARPRPEKTGGFGGGGRGGRSGGGRGGFGGGYDRQSRY